MYKIIIVKAFPNDDIPEVYISSSSGVSEGNPTYLQILDNPVTHIASAPANSSSASSLLQGLYI